MRERKGKKVIKRKKVVTMVGGTLCVLILIIGLGGFFIHQVVEDSVNEKVGYFQAVKSILTLNFDGEQEQQLKAERNKINYEHVSIYYLEEDDVLLPVTKETLEWAMQMNDVLLGDYKKRPLDLIYFKDRNEMSHFTSLNKVSGFYSDFDKVIGITTEGKEEIVQRLETPLFLFQKTLLHEYTHYAFKQRLTQLKISYSDIPQWFEEGICEYVSYDQTTLSPHPFTLVPFVELNTNADWSQARTIEDTELYMQSYLAIDYLIEEHGTEIILAILEETKSHNDFNKGFENVTGINLIELEEQINLTLGF
jgi:hypothetical protein